MVNSPNRLAPERSGLRHVRRSTANVRLSFRTACWSSSRSQPGANYIRLVNPQARALLEYAAEHPIQNHRLDGVHGSVQLVIGDAGVWRVLIDDGTVTVADSTSAAESSVALDEDDLVDIVSGRQNALALFLRGRLHVAGDPGLALIVFRLMAHHGQLTGPT